MHISFLIRQVLLAMLTW